MLLPFRSSAPRASVVHRAASADAVSPKIQAARCGRQSLDMVFLPETVPGFLATPHARECQTQTPMSANCGRERRRAAAIVSPAEVSPVGTIYRGYRLDRCASVRLCRRLTWPLSPMTRSPWRKTRRGCESQRTTLALHCTNVTRPGRHSAERGDRLCVSEFAFTRPAATAKSRGCRWDRTSVSLRSNRYSSRHNAGATRRHPSHPASRKDIAFLPPRAGFHGLSVPP